MKTHVLFLLLLGPVFPSVSNTLPTQKCETWEDDCERGGDENDDPTRPGDPENPDDPGSDGL